MKNRKYTIIAVLSLVMLLGMEAQSQVVVQALVKPNAQVVRCKAPSANHVWIAGEWQWNRRQNQYIWVQGKWARTPKNKCWKQGNWKRVRGGYTYVPGRWRRC